MRSFISFLRLINFIFTFKVAFSNSLYADEPSTCKVSEPLLPLIRLKDFIFCDYESSIRPKKQGQNTTVNIMLIPKTMNYDSGLNKFSLNSMLKVEWMDEHLKWNPEEFDKISEIHVANEEIWVPDLSVWNSADTNSVMIFSKSTSCLVMYTGYVVCVPLVETTVHCSSDFENWPFETQICKIIFSSYFHFNEEISLNFGYNEVITNNLVPHQEWDVINTTVSSRIDVLILPRIIYEFQLKRHSKMMLTLYVVPLIVLVFITLTTLWMDVNSVERMSLSGLNFLSHLFCFYDLHWQLAENGNQTPRLVALYKNSLALTGFSVVLTILLRKLNSARSSSKWISSISSFVLKYRIGRLFILNDEEAKCFVENEEDDNNLEYVSKTGTKNVWRHFAKIIEFLSFLTIFFTFLFTYLST